MKAVLSVRALAKRLSLSPATVSLALRGDSAVAKATIARVKEGAIKYGYQPNAALALALSREKSRVKSPRSAVSIAFLTDGVSANPDLIPSWKRPYLGLLPKAQERGFAVEIVNARHFSSTAELRRILFHRGFRAIVVGEFFRHKSLQTEDWTLFAMAAVGRYSIKPRLHCVRRDEASAIRLICEKIRLGNFKRAVICLRHHLPLLEDDLDRQGAWVLEAPSTNAQLWHAPIQADDAPALAHFVKSQNADLVVGFNAGDYWKLKMHGLQPKQDFAYWQLHVDENLPNTTGIPNDHEVFGERVFPLIERLLHAGMLGIPKVAEDIVLQPEWVEAP